jgi:hypothetical protein
MIAPVGCRAAEFAPARRLIGGLSRRTDTSPATGSAGPQLVANASKPRLPALPPYPATVTDTTADRTAIGPSATATSQNRVYVSTVLNRSGSAGRAGGYRTPAVDASALVVEPPPLLRAYQRQMPTRSREGAV